jgi:hypothetical protein
VQIELTTGSTRGGDDGSYGCTRWNEDLPRDAKLFFYISPHVGTFAYPSQILDGSLIGCNLSVKIIENLFDFRQIHISTINPANMPTRGRFYFHFFV